MVNPPSPESHQPIKLTFKDCLGLGLGALGLIACSGVTAVTPEGRLQTPVPIVTKIPDTLTPTHTLTFTPSPTSTPTETSTPTKTPTPKPTETKVPPTKTPTKVPEPTRTPVPKYINKEQWNGLSPEQQDYAIDQWAKSVSKDQAITNAQVVERALPYIKMFAHEKSYPLDPSVEAAVNAIIAERGSPAWATDWQNQDYERGFFYVRTIHDGRTSAACNIDAFIQITSSGIYTPGSFPSYCSPEAQKLITNLEFAGVILKEGGGSRLFRHVKDKQGYESVEQVAQYFLNTKGSMGIWEAITLPIGIQFWTWVKNNVNQITSDPNVQREIVQYSDEVIRSLSQIVKDKKVDFNPGFP